MGARDDDLKPNRQTASIASFFATTRATTATRATRDDGGDDGGGKRARTGERATEAIAVDEEEATRDDAGAARRDDAVDLTMEGEETIATASGGGGGGGDAARDGARASREGEGSRVKVHSFFTNFAKRRKAAATAREGEGGTVRETQAEFVRVKPAPIEEALGPVHVGYVPIAYERRTDATSTTVSFSTRVDDGERRPMTTHAFELVQLGRTAREDVTATRGGAVSRPSTSTESEEDAYLADVAVAANRVDVELDGVAMATESELARARGECRNALLGLKERGGQSQAAFQWVDRFKPTRGSDTIGQNAGVVESLQNWFRAWQGRIAMQAKGKVPPSPSRPCIPRKVYDSDDEEFWHSDEEEDDGLGSGESVANGVLISGPVGCGKTATVYALAKEFGFKVLEVNALDRRSGQEVLGRFTEATQSKRFGKKAKAGAERPAPANGGLKAFFGGASDDETKRKEAIAAKTKEDNEKADAQSLILFEEIDIQLASERGFMAALSQLVENTKRPIVFTSNTSILPDLSMNLPLARVRFDAPGIRECATYAALVSAAAKSALRPSDATSISLACKGDLRRTLHNAQFASFSDSEVHFDSIASDRHSTALIDAARAAVLDGVKHLGAIPVDAAKELHASLVERERADFESMMHEVECGLIRHQSRLARWDAMKEAKRIERIEAKKKLLGIPADKNPLDLVDSTKKEVIVDERTKEDEAEARIQAALAVFEPRVPLPAPDWTTFDAEAPAGGWDRARDELTALAALARSMSQVDVLRSATCVGITGPCRRDVPWSKETIGDAQALEDCAPSEDFYLSNGPARQTLGGSDNVSVMASEFITVHCTQRYTSTRLSLRESHPESEPTASQPMCAPATPVKASKRARGSTRAPLIIQSGSMHSTWRARVLAESAGGHTVNSKETTDRLGFLSRMVRLQSAPKALSSPNSRDSRRRTRNRRKHLALASETHADLLDISNFGGSNHM
jgi:DNA polymerase III delta prime subunit